MGLLYSFNYGPTDSVAGTKTGVSPTTATVGRQAPPMSGVIKKIRVGKGNVVNAKECAGKIEVEVGGVNGPFIFAYGNGSGGATNNGQNGPAEPIDAEVPVPAGAVVKVWVTDAEIAKDVTVELEVYSGGGHMRSYDAGGAGSDTTADTQLTVGTITPVVSGNIKQIRFAGSGIVDAKAGSAKLVLSVPGQAGPFEFTVGNGPGGATLGGPQHADVIGSKDEPLNIPVKESSNVVVYLTSAEVLLSATCSLLIG